MCDYRSLPREGATEYFDPYARAGYSYDPVKKILNSYDTVLTSIDLFIVGTICD